MERTAQLEEQAWRLLAEQYLKRTDASGQAIGAAMRDRPEYRDELLNDPAFSCAIAAIVEALDIQGA